MFVFRITNVFIKVCLHLRGDTITIRLNQLCLSFYLSEISSQDATLKSDRYSTVFTFCLSVTLSLIFSHMVLHPRELAFCSSLYKNEVN